MLLLSLISLTIVMNIDYIFSFTQERATLSLMLIKCWWMRQIFSFYGNLITKSFISTLKFIIINKFHDRTFLFRHFKTFTMFFTFFVLYLNLLVTCYCVMYWFNILDLYLFVISWSVCLLYIWWTWNCRWFIFELLHPHGWIN